MKQIDKINPRILRYLGYSALTTMLMLLSNRYKTTHQFQRTM
jgi:hypothetical protein